MAIDREATLTKAEKFLRIGRLDAAITEYARVVEDQPHDWTTANTLGDLYLRAAQSDRAVDLYRRIADHMLTEGFYPKAGAVYKKILKITPDDEAAQIRLAEVSVRQGLIGDAKAFYLGVASRRRQRGDAAGADQMLIQLGAIDPADLSARLGAAGALERSGDARAAARHYRELYDEFLHKGRDDEAAEALQNCVRCDPATKDAALLLPLTALELRAGRLAAARALLQEVLASGGTARKDVVALAWTLVDTNAEAALLCVDAAADALIAAGEPAGAAAILQEFASRAPGQIGALLRIVEIAVDAGLDATMYSAQAQLADAYLAAGRPGEARVIAEDLVTRDPADGSHIDRLRRALEMLNIADVEGAIEARMNAAEADLAAARVELVAERPASPVERAPLLVPPPRESPEAEDAGPAHAASIPERPPAAGATAEIDLTALLGELEGPSSGPAAWERPPARDLEDVFAGLRADAGRAEEGDDSEDHLALARAYIEMGSPDEAVASLEVAVRSPRHRFEAASALAHLYRDQSDLEKAIEWFERATEAPAPDPELGYALLYDLGDVLEAMGETARALAVFLELAADVPDFRDVGARVTQLSNAETEG